MATKQDNGLKQAYKAYEDFIKLCRLLFNHKNDKDDEPAKTVNQLISKDNEFYSYAVKTADECEMDWDNLSAEDSDELILILLDDFYNRINVDGKSDYIINISIKNKETDKGAE